MNAVGLSPCPFCGGAAEFGEVDDADDANFGGQFIQCTNPRCETSSALIFPLKGDVADLLRERWNARPSSSAPATSPSEEGATLQRRVQPWMMACFGPEIAADKIERNHRFLEEALELVQACGCPQLEAHQLVDYVYGRDQGDINQEVGGVMITLAALCLANGFDMHAAGEAELSRIWTKIDKIRAKQAAKPRGSALPIAPSYAAAPPPELGKATGEQT